MVRAWCHVATHSIACYAPPPCHGVAPDCTGTNLVLLIFKGVKMLFMSALFQFGIWMCMRSMCGKKRAKGTLNLALSDGDAATYKAENPMQRA